MKSKIRLVKHVKSMEKKNAYQFLVGKRWRKLTILKT